MDCEDLPPFNKDLQIGSGAFGVVYIDRRDPSQAIKRFKSPQQARTSQALHELVRLTRWARPSEVHQLVTRFAWPLAIECEPKNHFVTAYCMPRAPETCYFNLSIVSRLADRARPGSFTETRKDRRETLQLKYLIDDSWWQGQQIRSQKPQVDEPGRIEIAIDCCDSLQVLHSHGLVYGDISSNNIVARLDPIPGAYFFDADSIAPADLRRAEPLLSPGWETPLGLDPFAIDRSRAALVVLRLLTETPNARPSDPGILNSGGYVVRTLLPYITTCFETGREDAFGELIGILRTLRTVPDADSVFDRAVQLGFARTLLREHLSARTSSQRLVVEQARAQVLFEDQVDNTVGLEHRRLLRQANLRMGAFKLDSKPRFEPLKPITNEQELVDLLFDGSYQSIANVLTSSGLGALEQHFAVNRAVGYALLQTTPVSPEVVIEAGKATCTFRWPREEFVNCARVRARFDSGKEEFQMYRRRGSSMESRVIMCPRGSRLDIQVEYGTRSASGAEFYPTFGQSKSLFLHESAQIPPLPAPARPSVSSSSSAPAGFLPPEPDVVIVDPEAERLAQELLERQARSTRRRRIAVALASVILIAGGFLGYRHFTGGPNLRSLSKVQAASAPDDWGIGYSDLQLAKVTPSSIYVDFNWMDPTTFPAYRLQYSYDGSKWSSPKKVQIAKTGSSFRWNFTEDGTPPLFLIESLDEAGKVVQREFLNVLHDTGFSTYPEFEVIPDGVRISVEPSVLAGERVPIAYVVQGFSLTGGGPFLTYLRRVDGTEFVVPASSQFPLTHVNIRSIFGPGEAGPWIGIGL